MYIQNVNRLARNALNRNIRPILVKQALDYSFVSVTSESFWYYRDLYAKARTALDDVAKAYGIDIIDAANLLLEGYSPVERKEIFYDVVHLTAKGNRILAQILYNHLSVRLAR